MKNINKTIAWWIFGILSVSIGLYPIVYFIIDPTFGLLGTKEKSLLTDTIWNSGFYGHILLGGLSLLVGWTQFSTKLRVNNLAVHRFIGKVYLIAALLGGLCGVYIGWYATGGIVSKLGFILLGIVWMYTTLKAYVAIRQKNIKQHEYFMIYSYAACWAAVTLRIWLPILTGITGEFINAYRIVAWLCWVPNIVVAYFIVRHKMNKHAFL